jgi:hypothetical protein
MKKRTERTDVLPARRPQPLEPSLQEPRPPPWSDLVAAGRRWLLHQWAAEPKPTRVSPPWRLESGSNPAFAGVAKYVDATAAPRGPYSVDPDITNDDLGYGERVSDRLLRVGGDGDAKERKRVRQRTKTGWQTLTPAVGTRSPGDERALPDARPRARGARSRPGKTRAG